MDLLWLWRRVAGETDSGDGTLDVTATTGAMSTAHRTLPGSAEDGCQRHAKVDPLAASEI
jgi:hypothetical protein